jgi:hypothetical protein
MNPTEIEEIAEQHLSRPFMRALASSVFLARREAWEACGREFARPESENLMPFYVRAKLEGYMRDAAERFGLASAAERAPGQPWNHTEVKNGPIVLTAATVSSPLAMVDASDYRQGLARSNQLRFASMDAPPPDDAPLYALLLHCRSEWPTVDEYRQFAHLPGAVHIAFPAADLDAYVHAINLFDWFRDVVRQFTPQEWTDEAVVRYIARSQRSGVA